MPLNMDLVRSNLQKLLIPFLILQVVPRSATAQEISSQAKKYYQKGIEAGSLDEKVRQLRKAIEIEPLFAAAVFHLGKSYYQIGHYQQAIEELARAVRLDSALHRSARRYLRNAYAFVAVELNGDGHYPLALNYAQQALEIDDNYAPGLRALGIINLNLGDRESALRAFKRSLAIDSNQDLAWFQLGDLYFNMEEYDKSVEAFEQALEINPDLHEAQSGLEIAKGKNRPEVWLERADEALAKADSESARGFLQKALVLDPNNDIVAAQFDSLSRKPNYLRNQPAPGDSNLSLAGASLQVADSEKRSSEERDARRTMEQTRLLAEKASAGPRPDSPVASENFPEMLPDKENAGINHLAVEPGAPEPAQIDSVRAPPTREVDDATDKFKDESAPDKSYQDSTSAGAAKATSRKISRLPTAPLKSPKIMTVAEAIGIVSGVLVLSFILFRLKNNFQTTTLSEKAWKALHDTGGFVRPFVGRLKLSTRTITFFKDKIASDTPVSFNLIDTAGLQSEASLPQGEAIEMPEDKLLSMKETRTILGGIKKVRRIGRYIIEKEIARSAGGQVFKAWDPRLDRTVVIKQVAFDFGRKPSEYNNLKIRLFREARAAASLNHPNIVVIYDIDEQDGFCYIVMEYIEGEDLSALLERKGKLALAPAIRIILQVCAALDYAHQNGIIHRDIKPSNILLAKNDSVKVADFGIAKLPQSGTLTQTGDVLGTPFYMSPEQIEGRQLTGLSDIFSVGVVLYEMITGVRPFDSDGIPSLVYKIIHKFPELPSRINHQLPAEIDTLIERALAKDPDKRFESAPDLIHALNEFMRVRHGDHLS